MATCTSRPTASMERVCSQALFDCHVTGLLAQCRLHIVFHGCFQSAEFIGAEYANSTKFALHCLFLSNILSFLQLQPACRGERHYCAVPADTYHGPQPQRLLRLVRDLFITTWLHLMLCIGRWGYTGPTYGLMVLLSCRFENNRCSHFSHQARSPDCRHSRNGWPPHKWGVPVIEQRQACPSHAVIGSVSTSAVHQREKTAKAKMRAF